MNSEFVEGWEIAQTLGEGTFGEYVLSFTSLKYNMYFISLVPIDY